ncbi:carboxylesterase family protein [Truncatella angustata]|uniref:Carboxylesterase family protein n=1 Tax=Truncatella angustata TaxID=152316 RepID=A0A9P8UV58_9PEZI|nr:carboxylesterase family protein [Truncatella angustata]KAH6658932.1 carboxylesterase family protein [Truncatella angustata]KAH8196235.1 hypothetical protein TruAng_009592 [Truncatella angustata]
MQFKTLTATLWLAGAAFAGECRNITGPVVHDTRHHILYRGSVNSDTESFQNIRFGQDTSGVNRFKHPRPFFYPSGSVVNATKAGAACPQVLGNPLPQFFGIYGNVTEISEDCLTVRVTRPLGTHADDKLPVMVYLFGSGYNFGSIYDEIAYDATGLVRETAKKGLPVIYVAINYRVGVFGFASSNEIRAENNINSGLLDQYLGLQWVQQNIGAFGGDKGKVTIFGQNVGWTNVQLQLTAFGGTAEPLFRRAVLMSGPTSAGLLLNAGLSDVNTANLAASLNCTAKTGNQTSVALSCLRSLPLETLTGAAVAYANTFSPLGGIGTWRPTAPSPFIPASPSALLREGRFRKNVDILVGWNEEDGTLFVPQTTNSSKGFTAVVQTFFPGLSAENLQALSDDLYPAAGFHPYPREGIDANFYRAAQVIRDAQFTCPSLRLARALASGQSSNVFAYSLNTSVLRHGHALYNRSFVGTDHFSDIPYVFDTVAKVYSAVADQSDYDMASRTSASWAAFAHFGQPTIPGLSDEQLQKRNLTFPDWSPVSDGYELRVLGGVRDGMAELEGSYDERIEERCDFWGQESVLSQTWA